MAGFTNDILNCDNVNFSGTNPTTGQVSANGQLLIGSAIAPNIRVGNLLSADNSITITNSAGGIDLAANTSVIPDLHVAKWIVNPTANSGGNQTTIQAAINAASAGETVFIMAKSTPYTENLTLKAGVNLVGFMGDDSTGNVTFKGNCTLSSAGTVSISNIKLETNGASCITVSGSAASILNILSCTINCTDSTGISFSSSNASSKLTLYDSNGDIGTTGIALFNHSSAGQLSIKYSDFTNTGASTTTNTCSAGSLTLLFSTLQNPITTSGTTADYSASRSGINCNTLGVTALTINSTRVTPSSSADCSYASGSAAAVSIGAGASLNLPNNLIGSNATNAITGSGTVSYSNLTFFGTSSTINTTTQVGGTIKGSTNTAPSASFLGERIVSTVASGSAVSLTNSVVANVTSISLSPGVWDVSSLGCFGGAPTGFSGAISSISTTSATTGTLGNNSVASPTAPTAGSTMSISIPSHRIVVSSTTTVYLVAFGVFTGGTLTGFGRISAVRVG